MGGGIGVGEDHLGGERVWRSMGGGDPWEGGMVWGKTIPWEGVW